MRVCVLYKVVRANHFANDTSLTKVASIIGCQKMLENEPSHDLKLDWQATLFSPIFLKRSLLVVYACSVASDTAFWMLLFFPCIYFCFLGIHRLNEENTNILAAANDSFGEQLVPVPLLLRPDL